MTKFIAIILTLGLSACTSHMFDVSMISNKPIDLEKLDLANSPKKRHIVGEHETYFVVIPLGSPSLYLAVNDALKKGNGDLIIDASVHRNIFYALVGARSYTIKGTVVNTGQNEVKVNDKN